MKFKAMKGCRRPVREQRYIWALLGTWDSLPMDRRAELRRIISAVCGDDIEERALFDVLIRKKEAAAVAARTGITARRLYDLRCRFYERVEIR